MSEKYRRSLIVLFTATGLVCLLLSLSASGQQRAREAENEGTSAGDQSPRGGVRTVTIPITIREKGSKAQQEVMPVGELAVREDGEAQRILSVRDIGNAPLSVAILIQDDVVSSIGNDIKAMKEFILRLPRGSRVMVGYIRSGSLQVRQKFTTDLEKAASALRIPLGSAGAAPFNPYVEIREAVKRFEGLPTGRRSMLVVSDGVDTSRGFDSSTPSQSIDLARATKEAQRQSVAVYSFYAPTVALAASNNQLLMSNGLSSLERLADETGGRAFFQGTGVPVSFDPYLRELAISFARQKALTYLSTHPNKGYHRIEVKSGLPNVEIDHPAGYTR
jgi:VWFA-related protein